MAFTAKTAAGTKKKVEFLSGVAEGNIVLDRCFREHIERADWLNALKAELCKLVVKIDSVAVVNFNINLAVKAVWHNSFEKRVCVYKATYSVSNI